MRRMSSALWVWGTFVTGGTFVVDGISMLGSVPAVLRRLRSMSAMSLISVTSLSPQKLTVTPPTASLGPLFACPRRFFAVRLPVRSLPLVPPVPRVVSARIVFFGTLSFMVFFFSMATIPAGKGSSKKLRTPPHPWAEGPWGVVLGDATS